jgi:hypothetical protein
MYVLWKPTFIFNNVLKHLLSWRIKNGTQILRNVKCACCNHNFIWFCYYNCFRGITSFTDFYKAQQQVPNALLLYIFLVRLLGSLIPACKWRSTGTRGHEISCTLYILSHVQTLSNWVSRLIKCCCFNCFWGNGVILAISFKLLNSY